MEINLKELIFQVLYRWKAIIVFAIVIALLAGAFMGIREHFLMIDDTGETNYAEELLRYQENLAISQNRVSSTQDKIDTLQDYIDHAVMLNASIEKHSLTLMLDTLGVYVNEDLKDRQQSVYDEMIVLQETLIKEKEELKKLEENEPSELSIPFACVKGVILGGAMGVFLAAAYIVAMFLLRGRIYSADSLNSYGMAYFGSIMRDDKKLDPISKWLRMHGGRIYQNSEENKQFVAANIKYYCGDVKSILLCSDVSAADSELIAASLGEHLPEVQFEAVGCLSNEARAMQLLPQSEAVVMVVSAGLSHRRELAKALSVIRCRDIKVAGFILID